jgi:hypothetical protein
MVLVSPGIPALSLRIEPVWEGQGDCEEIMTQEQTWIHGGIYRDAVENVLYTAQKSHLGWAFYRLNIVEGVPMPIIISGRTVGYQQDPNGFWHVLRVGDPKYTTAPYIMSPHTDFDIDILPNLTFVAVNLGAYLKGVH